MTTLIYNKCKLITDTKLTLNYTDEQYEEALGGFLAAEGEDEEVKYIYRPSLDRAYRHEVLETLKNGKYYIPSGRLKQNGETIKAIGIAGDAMSAWLVLQYLDKISSEDTMKDYLSLVVKVITTFDEGFFFSLIFLTDTGAWILDGNNKAYKFDKTREDSVVLGSGVLPIKGIDNETFQACLEANDLSGVYFDTRPIDELKTLALGDPLTNNNWKELVI